MKKLLTYIFTLMFFTPIAHAADGTISRVIPTSNDTKTSASDQTSTSRTTVARAPTTQKSDITVRSTVSRVFSGAPDIQEPQRDIVSRSGTITRSITPTNKSETNTARSNLETAVNTVGRNKRVSAASINNDPTVRRAGVVLRPSTAEVGGRATIGDSGIQTGSNIDEAVRRVQSRAATAESIVEAQQRLEQTATLNKSCQEQYNDCMDQFCAVIDANQKRCSCSSNIKKYAKVEEAVKDANNQLNDVAQRIRYVGLSADEIRAIMTETEAEEALSGQKDKSETRNMLAEIEELIANPNIEATGTFSPNSMLGGLDMTDLNFSTDSANLFSLDFLNTDTTSSFSNLRGSELYNAAKSRCRTILNQCKDAGATPNQISGNYDLAIDKDCIAYEQGLTKMNETLVSNVRSAGLMLQKARLAVLQNKNQYDAKGCIAALNTCMTDDMVCGSNYFKCIDPTKKYIDENGEVVLGQDISKITDFMKDFNASIGTEFLDDSYKSTITDDFCSGTNSGNSPSGADGKCVAKYLLTKIGTKQNVTDEGLCRAVLDKCQYYTYKDETYQPYNDVVVNYIQRAMVNIRAAQSKIISEYASGCMLDIADCYNKQVSQINSWSSSATVDNISRVMRGACRNVALTCGYAIFAGEEDDTDDTDDTDADTIIDDISAMFYQSLLCPENSTYYPISQDEFPNKCSTSGQLQCETDGNSPVTDNGVGNGYKWINQLCRCNTGYVAWGSQCMTLCPTHSSRNNATGKCECVENYTMQNGTCVQNQQ
ncbi:MAG: hypothetical protein IKW67_02925 [Alphaproteobacteria bacterium]|nr:hypothetical protein [Alphaproteobacteria bacterium]